MVICTAFTLAIYGVKTHFFPSFRYPNLVDSDGEDALLEYLAAPDQATKS